MLGTVSVEGFGQVYDQFPTRRSALILIRLALADGRTVGRDALASVLWPDEFSEATKPRLRQELTRLRRALGDAAEVLESDRLSLRISQGKAQVDLQSAERHILKAELEPDPTRKIRFLETLGEYADEIAPGFDETWIVGTREEWRGRCSDQLLTLAEAYEVRRDPERALAVGRKAALCYLLSEAVQGRYLQLLVRLGRHEEAGAHLAELDRLYPQMLGTGPTRRLAHLLKPHLASESRPALGRITKPQARPLPASLSELFGRSTDLERLGQSLKPGPGPRLVTLCGPGGIGKTQLALAAGRELAPTYRDRIWFVGLSEVTSPARIGPALLETLGIASIERDPIDVAGQALAGEPSLLILDNFEQLVDGGAQFVRKLLERCADLKLLVTTRRKLNVEGEQEQPVGPLPLSSSVDLFLAVARSTRHSLTVDDSDLQRVTDIVRLMDQMPLAIHLAASRVGVMSLTDIERQLGRRFDLLVSRRGDLELRHRTMRQTVAWSYEQLSSELQRFFVDLSIFHGGWTAGMAAEVLNEPNALALLEELRENSFLIEDPLGGEMRFDMLVTLREFAVEKQDLKRTADHRRRLCHFLIQLADDAAKHLLSPDQAWWYQRLEREHDNVLATLAWASESAQELGLELCSRLWRFWCVRGHHREARGWFDRFLPAGTASSPVSAAAMFGAARCAAEQGDARAAERWYIRARQAWSDLGNHDSVVMNDINWAGLFLARGEKEEAHRRFLAGLGQLDLSEGSYIEGICRDDLASSLLALGELEEAERQLDSALAILENHPDRIAVAYCWINIGRLMHLRGNHQAANERFQGALEIHRRLDIGYGIGIASEWLARSALAEDRLDRALAFIEDSTQARNQVGDSMGIAHLHRLRASVEVARGNQDEARRHLKEAARLFRACGCDRFAEECSNEASDPATSTA